MELRRRLERLEHEVAALRGPAPAPTPPLVRAPVGSEPPPLPRPTPARPAGVGPSRIDRLVAHAQHLPSTAWVAAAGAAIFLIGAIYGLTVSIQRGWISEPVRVGAGLVTGVAVGVAATRLLLGGRREVGVSLLAVAVGTWTFALYFGAKSAHLFPLGLGFAGAAVATLFAGALAARLRSDATMAVALIVGLVAPIAFSSGTGTFGGLVIYLSALLGAQLLAHYVTGEGAEWRASRVLGSVGPWAVTVMAGFSARLGEPALAFGALAMLTTLGLVLAWLPRHPHPAEEPVKVSTFVLVAAALATWAVWRRAGYERELYSVVLVGLAALSLALIVAGRRSGRVLNEAPLVLVAAGFGLLAVPMAVSWRWVALSWGLGALLLALGARRRARDAEEPTFSVGANVVAVAATLVWFVQAANHWHSDRIFLNPVFAGGLLTAGAWAVLLGTPGQARRLAGVALQLVAINAVAWELSRAVEPVAGEQATIALGALLATLTYAGAGAGLWLRGVLYEFDAAKAKALRLSGYGWLLVAAVKLLGYDLSNRDLLFRAVAALGVGAVFIGAALWADRVRAKRENES